jgi:putative spermidine/putrescine transport system ATP-binding protein
LRAVGAAADGPLSPATLVSRVAAVEYQGSTVKLLLEADGIDELTVTLRDHSFYANAVAAGDKVAVSWNDADVHVLS